MKNVLYPIAFAFAITLGAIGVSVLFAIWEYYMPGIGW